MDDQLLRIEDHGMRAGSPFVSGGFLLRGSRRLRMLADSFHHHHVHLQAVYMRAFAAM